jgi:hypothetical protein
MSYNQRSPDAEKSRELASMAEDAVKAFREENNEAYEELTRTFEGKAADVVLLGNGRFHVSVWHGELRIEPDRMKGEAGVARGLIAPETLLELLEGRRTPLEAFFAGDLVAQADSKDLHLAYNSFVKFADTAMRSKNLQEMLDRFKQTVSFRSEKADRDLDRYY